VDREGSTKPAMKGTEARQKEGFATRFTAGDFWFTAKQNKVYVNAFTKPVDGLVKVKTLAKGNPQTRELEVRTLRLLGYAGNIKWKQTASALEVEWPKGFDAGYGYCFEIGR